MQVFALFLLTMYIAMLYTGYIKQANVGNKKVAINKSKLFKMAWKAFRSNKFKNRTFSSCLKWAWKAIRNNQDEEIVVSADLETPKALAFVVNICCEITDQESKRKLWIPKSMVKNNCVASWFLQKKINEIRESFNYISKLSIHFNNKVYYR